MIGMNQIIYMLMIIMKSKVYQYIYGCHKKLKGDVVYENLKRVEINN